MPWRTTPKRDGNVTEFFRYDSDDRRNTESLVYKIDRDAQTVTCFLKDRYLKFDKIEFIGFAKLPPQMNVRGSFKTKPALSAIRRLSKTLEIERMIVSKVEDSGVAVSRNLRTLTLNYSDFKQFIEVMKKANSLNQAELRRVADIFFLRFCDFDSSEEDVLAQGRLTKLLDVPLAL